jgi:hypothetical protein
MPEIKNPGEDKAWEILASLTPKDVCKKAEVSYHDTLKSYVVPSFGLDYLVSVKDRTLSSEAPGSKVLLGRLGYFFRLSVLWYLVQAKDIDCTGRPVKLEQIKGGDIFTRGSHVLPLDLVANTYRNNTAGFIEKGERLGGQIMQHGDASLRLAPFPRIPAFLTLWKEDEEFPARVDLMFDSTCELQLPTDIIWSIAMMNLLIMV